MSLHQVPQRQSRIFAAFVVFAFVLFADVLCSAANYYVAPVYTADANPSLTASLQALVASAVGNNGGTVVDSPNGANYTLKTSLIRLGGAYVLTVTKISANGAQYSAQQKSPNVENLDDAVARAVRGAMIATPPKKDVRVGDVQPEEENQLKRRIQTRSSTYLGFGPGGFANMGDTRLAYDLAIGHLWETTPHAAIKVTGQYVTSGDLKTYYLMGTLGMNYYFTDEDSAPYISAGLGYGGSGSLYSSATTIGGFAGNIGLGYEFFRTTSTQFDVYAGYSTIFGNNTIGTPGAFSLRIGVLF